MDDIEPRHIGYALSVAIGFALCNAEFGKFEVRLRVKRMLGDRIIVSVAHSVLVKVAAHVEATR